jgi:hypothetical protein
MIWQTLTAGGIIRGIRGTVFVAPANSYCLNVRPTSREASDFRGIMSHRSYRLHTVVAILLIASASAAQAQPTKDKGPDYSVRGGEYHALLIVQWPQDVISNEA